MELEPELTEYEAPEVVDYGDLVELTAGQSTGHSLDSAFHTDTHYPSFSS